ncbi:MAG TPA: discoidin domain-containing protein [Armatimonadota bacterium]|nr:discoidin domain-containing protein [Armatimonadota bacterium]
MRTLYWILTAILLTAGCTASETISLAGQWKFALDPQNVGISEGWFNKALPETVMLPGSTDTNHKGIPNKRKPDLQHPSRLYEYTGPAWYQREITVPREWAGKRVVLFLERCHWETQVWLDGKPCGMQDSLCVPHVHELNASPGVHRLTIRVDNTIKYNVGAWAHSITEETQTNWNGIVGRIELQAAPKNDIESVQVYPESKSIKVKASVHGPFSALKFDVLHSGKLVASKTVKGAETTIPIPDPKPWDEFSPSLYTLSVSPTHMTHMTYTTHFAMRDLRVTDKRLVLNGRKIFLRGTLECCIFPKTGYPPTDVDSWLRILKICKSYGLNHMRFHSWCPPEAAFQAADQMGFLLQVELPQWVGNVGQDLPRDQFIQQEMLRILDTYGNHSSFGMLCMGNELRGDESFLQKLVVLGQQHDPRHLYSQSTAYSFGDHDDYRVAAIRGLHGPTTDTDFSAQDATHPVPIVSHEIGQWAVFPNLAEMKKYTGVLRPSNFGLIRDGLLAHGVLDQAAAFTQASGKLSAELYKEEIEVLLRTPGHGGFQLLDLHDFPGQGTALVGTLDAFWDSKGIVKPEEWRRFCSPTVPLLRMNKRTWTTDETFTARVQVAHFGPKDITAIPMWAIRDQSGHDIASGILATKALPTGDLYDLGDISASLAEVSAPAKLTVTVSLKGTNASNSWNIWVYPPKADPNPSDVVVTQSIEEMTSNLRAGRKVLMIAPKRLLVQPGTGSPYTVFWDPVMFAREANKGEGILLDPKHPALAEFPTDSYADWQWFDLLANSSNMDLSSTPASFRPIVQVIDNFIKNRKMGNLLEAGVGDGRLMVCSMNVGADKPACLQMLKSILDYMASDAFQPKQRLTPAQLSTSLREQPPTALQSLGAKVLKVDSEDVANPATNAIDGDPDTFWHTQWQGDQPPYPHEIQIDLQQTIELTGFKYLPRQDMQNGWFTEYEFYVSEDAKDWGTPVAKGSFALDAKEKTILFAPCKGRYIRLVALKGRDDSPWAGIAELDVLLAH